MLLVDTFLMYCGFFMVIRLISIHYVEGLGWTAASIGIVLAVRQLLQQGSTPISGVIADHVGPKVLIFLGLFLRIFSFACMAFADNFPLLLFSAIITGLSGSLFEAPLAATITTLTNEKQRSRFYSLYGISGELGTVVGVQLGVILLNVDFRLLALVAASIFGLASLLTLFFLPKIQITGERTRKMGGVHLALHDVKFMAYTVLLMGFWFLFVQLNIAFPLAVKDVGASNETLGLLYAISSGMSIVLAYPVLRLAARWFSTFNILVIGMLLMTCGLGAVAISHGVVRLGFCVILITLGVMLAMPSSKTAAAELAHPQWLGTYLGLNAMAQGIGGALGNYAGGLLHDVGKQVHFAALPWLTFLVIGVVTSGGLWLLARSRNQALISEPEPLKG
jgi:DHA1 family multidrug resistance protein-like MFS transporter